MPGRGLFLDKKGERIMVYIGLTKEQIRDLQPEISKCEAAHKNGEPGILVLQVWYELSMATGEFIHDKPATIIAEIIRTYR